MTILKGRPEVPNGTALAVRLLWDVPLQGGPSRLSVKMLDGVWSWERQRWEKDANTPLTFPHPRVGQNDAALKGPLTAVVSVGAGAAMTSQTLHYLLQSFETAPGELDMTVDPQATSFLPTESLFGLILQLNAATTSYNAALVAFNLAVVDLESRSQGLAALKVRSENSYTDTGLELAYALEANDRLAFFIDVLGKTHIPLAEITSAIINVLAVDVLTIAQALTAPELTAAILRTNRLHVGTHVVSAGQDEGGVVWGIADSQGRLAIWVGEDGTFHAAQFGSEFGSSTGNTGGVSSSPNLTLKSLQLGAGRVAAEEDSLIAWALADSNDRLPAWLDPSGTFHFARPLGGPSWDLVAWGGDLIEALAPKLLIPPGQPFNLGWSDQTSGDVAARFGAMGKAATFTAAAATAGVYPLTLMNPDLSPLSGSVTRTLAGRLNGVRGVLTRTATGQPDALTNRGGYYTFTPDAGALIETGLLHAFSPDNPYRLETSVIAVGRADIGLATANSSVNDQLRGLTIAENIQAIVQSLSGRHERYVVLGLLNAKTEIYGAGLERIMAYNAQIASVAGHRYFDLRAVFCRNADGTWRADGSPDPQYMADNVKLNAAGLQRLATALIAFLIERGLYV